MDFEEGKEGGTWLAMNISGKIASVLNLVKPIDEINGDKFSRGFLVVKYLETQMDTASYLRILQNESNNYDGFQLVTLDIRPSTGKVNAFYYTNSTDKPPTRLLPGTHVFGNSIPSSPWKKLDVAKRKFHCVLSRHKKIISKESLIEDLFKILQDDTKNYPDEQLDKDGRGRTKDALKNLSAIFVKDMENFFGSRTHTVILIDNRGNVDYVEKTMREPIDFSSDISWISTRLQFSIQDSTPLISRL